PLIGPTVGRAEKAARRPPFRQAKADQPRSVVVSVAVTVAEADALRPAGQLEDVEAVALAVGRVDEAPVVHLEVVGHVAPLRLERGNDLGWQRNVETDLDGRLRLADVEGPHSAGEVSEE